MRKTAVLLCLMLFLGLLPVSAAQNGIQITQARVDMQTEKIIIEGTVDSASAGQEVLLRLFQCGKDTADVETDPEALLKIDQIISNADGKFSFPPFRIDIKDPQFISGNLKYYIDCNGQQYIGALYVASEDEINTALALLQTALKNGQGVEDALKNAADALALHSVLFDAVSNAGLAQLLIEEYAVNPSCVESEAILQQTVQKLALLQAYNEEKSELVVSGTEFLYPEILRLADLDAAKNISVYQYYTENMPETAKKTVIAAMMGRNLKTLDDFYRTFAQMVILQGVSNPKQPGWGHIRSLLSENGTYAGLNISTYLGLSQQKQDKVDTVLARIAFGANIQELQKAMDDAIKALETSQGGNTGGGSSGGGNSGGGSLGSSGAPIRVDNDLLPSNNVTQQIFSDMNGYEWAKDAVEALYAKKIINGVGDGRFEPAGQTTREQFVKMFVLLVQAELLPADHSFIDVDAVQWYATYLTTAKSMGIIEGKPDGSFGVGENITRQDVMVMLKRGLDTLQITLPESDAPVFQDAEEIAPYAEEAVRELSAAGIIQGDDNGTFRPNDFCSRAEAAVLLSRVLALL